MRPALALLLLPLAASGCFLSSETVHCSDNETDPENCIEFSGFDGGLFDVGLKASLGVLCEVVGSDPIDGACPTEGQVVGCAGDEQDQYDYVEWSYESDDVTSPDDVTCGSDEEKVTP